MVLLLAEQQLTYSSKQMRAHESCYLTIHEYGSAIIQYDVLSILKIKLGIEELVLCVLLS